MAYWKVVCNMADDTDITPPEIFYEKPEKLPYENDTNQYKTGIQNYEY